MHKKFWMVYSPMGGSPTYHHAEKGFADAEADRLARKQPGKPFFVLEAIAEHVVEQPPVRITELTVPDESKELPF